MKRLFLLLLITLPLSSCQPPQEPAPPIVDNTPVFPVPGSAYDRLNHRFEEQPQDLGEKEYSEILDETIAAKNVPTGKPSWQVVYTGPYVPNGADMTILDMFDYSEADIRKAKYPIAYFSAHYEDWRPDEKNFGKKLKRISGWSGEWYVDWSDPKNKSVMLKRLDLAVKKGFKGVDIDNVDGPNGRGYFPWLMAEAKKRGLTVGLKNFVEILPEYGSQVDFFVSEATKAGELECYRRYGKPVVRMGYGRGAGTPDFIYEVRSGERGNSY